REAKYHEPRRVTHHQDSATQSKQHTRQHDPGPEAAGQAATWQTECGTDQGRPEINSGVADSVDVEICNEWLGDESQPLCPARQCPDHRERGNHEIGPAVVDRFARTLLWTG